MILKSSGRTALITDTILSWKPLLRLWEFETNWKITVWSDKMKFEILFEKESERCILWTKEERDHPLINAQFQSLHL